MDTTTDDVGDHELERRGAGGWAVGDHARIATDLTGPLGAALAAAAGVGPGDRVLDVVGGGCSALPHSDAAFDVVLSRMGVVAPHHRRAADELVRVCRGGGTIGMLAWAADGLAAAIVRTVTPYTPHGAHAPAPRCVVLPELLGDRVVDVRVRRGAVTTDRYPTPEAWRDHWKDGYGPVAAVYRHLEPDPDEVAALDRDLASVATRFDCGTAATVLRWDYVVVTARRAGLWR
jgi:hypothetical protein